MDNLTALFGLLAALTMATERITEAVKGVPLWSHWLAQESANEKQEEFRKMVIHLLAIAGRLGGRPRAPRTRCLPT